MRFYFFDSSALVKAYIQETGTATVRQVLQEARTSPAAARVFACSLAHPEAASAVTRRENEASLTAFEAARAMQQIDRDFTVAHPRPYEVLDATRPVVIRVLAKKLNAQRRARKDESSVRSDLAEATLRRIGPWLTRSIEAAPSKVLKGALAEDSPRATLLHVFDVIAEDPAEVVAARLFRERALKRALDVHEELRREAGGMLNTAEVADRLGITRQAVDKKRDSGALLALKGPDGYAFPACQFTAAGVVEGLSDVLGALGELSFWEKLSALVTAAPALQGKSLIQALASARSAAQRERLVALARDHANE